MQVKEPARDSATIENLQAEIKVLNRRVAKLTAENAELLRKLAAVQTVAHRSLQQWRARPSLQRAMH
jgi:hypothetical protein